MSMKNEFLNKRSLRLGSYSVALTVIVIAAVVILNAIVGATQIRDRLKIDLTGQKMYTIGEETDKVLKELNQDVEIIGLFDQSEPNQYDQVVEFIKQYELKSGKIHIRYVDPDKEVAYIQNELDPDGVLGIQRNQFVVKGERRSKVLSYNDIFEQTWNQSSYQYYVSGLNAEYAFTGAIRYVAADEIPVIYYTQGNGEGDINSQYSSLKSSMELHGYELKPLTLTTVKGVPEDASVVLVLGPQQDLPSLDLEKLKVFMETGGDTILLFDPLENNVQMPNFEEFLAKFNLGLGYDMIFEMAANRSAYEQPFIFMPNVENNEINTNLDPSKFNMTLAYARSIPILQNQKEWITSTPLLTTSAEAVGKALIQGTEDITGPLNVAVAVENKGNKVPSKTVVIGNAFFATDTARDSTGTGEKFILNALNWMEDKKTDIFIAAKTYAVPTLENVSQQTMTLLFIGLIIVVPLIIIGVGVFIWLRRRHL
ncbi:MAG: GldG family protein [Thermoclostridium sp.]|nr:GldG family protein [Thermoclostridium sp.]